MHKLAKRELQVSCPKKRWTIAIGSHKNILIFYSRYPLDGVLDLSDFSNADFKLLSEFFSNETYNNISSVNQKWSFRYDYNGLTIKFNQHPFSGEINLGDIGTEYCIQLRDMFIKAQEL